MSARMYDRSSARDAVPRTIIYFSFAVMLMFSPLARAQGHPTSRPPNPPPPPPSVPASSTFDQQQIRLQSNQIKLPQIKSERDNCFLQPLEGIEIPTVGVASFQLSAKAKKEYASACSALHDRKYDKAEESLRRAIDNEPKYLVAWVTLGQLLAARQKIDDAGHACSQAQSADPMYLPAYLCLADVAARGQKWPETLKMSERALQIDPANDPVAYDYNAAANLNLGKLDTAEKSALKGIEIDRNHTDPRIHFLLAQIYDAKGDRSAEAGELREYLKFASPADAAMVKQYLSDVEKTGAAAVK